MRPLYRSMALFLGSSLFSAAFAGGGPNPKVAVGAKVYAHYGYDLKPTPYAGYVDGDPRPNGFDVDRAYFNLKARIDNTFSVRLTTDVARTEDEQLQAVLKYAYLQVALAEGVKLRFGSASTPMIGFSEQFWGHRWVAKSFADQEGVLNSADMGVHALGKHADGVVSWAASMVNGEGAGMPDVDHAKSFQARLTVDPIHGDIKLPISLFISDDFYTHEDIDSTTVLVAAIGMKHKNFGAWGEYLSETAGELKGRGVSGNLVGKVPELLNIVVRYDKWDPNTEMEVDGLTTMRGGVTKDFNSLVSAGFLYEVTESEADPDQPEKGIFFRMKAGF
jgi:hypothetical protein